MLLFFFVSVHLSELGIWSSLTIVQDHMFQWLELSWGNSLNWKCFEDHRETYSTAGKDETCSEAQYDLLFPTVPIYQAENAVAKQTHERSFYLSLAYTKTTYCINSSICANVGWCGWSNSLNSGFFVPVSSYLLWGAKDSPLMLAESVSDSVSFLLLSEVYWALAYR